MAYTEQSNQYDYTPNTDNPFEVAASYNDDLFGDTADRDVAAGEMGVGSLYLRRVASDIPVYYPYDFTFDTMAQLYGGFDTTPTPVYEWSEDDAFYEYEAQGVLEDATDVINNTTGANTYVPASSARYIIASGDKPIFKPYDTVRYETSSGYQHALITAVGDSGGNAELTLQSEDGSNLPNAGADDAFIQKLGTNLPQDLDYDPQPRSSEPNMYHSYVENPRAETVLTREYRTVNSNGAFIADLVANKQDKLFRNFRRDREVRYLLGSGQKNRLELSNGDQVYFSNGVWNEVSASNKHEFSFSSGFSASEFKDYVNKFVLYNFGGESGGPQVRDLYVDPTMADYFDRAYEDKQRFFGTEFVAGVMVRRFENSNGAMDIVNVPTWSEIHPLKRAGVRNGGTTKGIGLLLPMDEEHVVRVNQEGMGPMQEVFKKDGGDRTLYVRTESKEGLALKNREHMAAFSEA